MDAPPDRRAGKHRADPVTGLGTIGDYALRPATVGDVPAIMAVMAAARAALPVQDWFVPDDEAYIRGHIDSAAGFCLVAQAPDGTVAAYLTVKLAGAAPDALGRLVGMGVPQLMRTAQMDSCCVAPGHRGNSLEGALLLTAERCLRARGTARCALATVHPDNAASLYSFLHRGYCLAAAEQRCYGGKRRHILRKDW